MEYLLNSINKIVYLHESPRHERCDACRSIMKIPVLGNPKGSALVQSPSTKIDFLLKEFAGPTCSALALIKMRFIRWQY